MYILKGDILLLFFLLHIALTVMVFFISSLSSRSVDRFGVLLIALSYILIVFFRQGLGVDETTYRDAYALYLVNPSAVEFEYSFKFLLFCFQQLSISPDNFNNIICCLYILLISLLILNVTPAPYMSLCLLLFLFSSVSLDFIFNAYRQGFAFIFVFASLTSYRANRKMIAAILMIAAIGFHWSSLLIPILLMGFRLIPKSKYQLILTVILLFTAIGFVNPLGILPILKSILATIPFKNYYFDKVSFYLTTSESSLYDLNIFGRLPLMVNTLLLLGCCRIFYKYINQYLYRLCVVIGLYCLIFMEMSFSFRNYYWLLPLLSFILSDILINYRNSGKTNTIQFVGIILIGHLILSLLTYYTSPLIPLVF